MLAIKHKALFKEQCYIDGKWVAAENQKVLPVINPFDKKLLGYVPECGETETIRAVTCAHQAFLSWQKCTAQERSNYLTRWADLIAQHLEDLAIIMTLEQGKPLSESRGEIEYGNAFIRWFSEEAKRIYGDIISSKNPLQRIFTIKQPLGVVGAITPWNFPMAMLARKCAPALAAGCTVVLKPAEDTPFSALALAQLAHEAEIPPGVINVITGLPDTIGQVLTHHPQVKKISFTGSTAVGKKLMAQCAGTIKKLSLELGGNAPFIVFADALLDAAIDGLIACKFRNSGQTCIAANRIFVQDTIYAPFVEQLIRRVQSLKTGNGMEKGVQLGPLINDKALEKLTSLMADAIHKGAKCVLGGNVLADVGALCFQPTILTGMYADMRMAQEEIFGPVAAIFSFQTEEEVIKQANNTPYGLAAYCFTEDRKRLWRIAEGLESGMVGLNAGLISTEVAPFGGVKESGIGREGSKYGIEEYLEIKYICMA